MSESSSTVSIRICQEGHANSLALNRNFTQIAVAGRSLLKVFSIENDEFTETCNMRGKNQNLSYSSNDVAWSDNKILATAATNGVISVWDLEKFGRQKQFLTYNEHERTAHSVTFHSTDTHLLLSGSQDGTIKCFDIRQDKSVYTYYSNSESVRDVKFNPHSQNIFAAVSENGTVQLWDMRKWEKSLLQFTAHSGPIYCCDWHSTKNWLATGSRDKQIKVYDMEGRSYRCIYTIPTIAVVGRIKWRPEKPFKNHIASCALVVDYNVHIWDIRRPYIPYASFNEHSNITTGIAFKGSDPYTLLSTSKDSTIYKHSFRDATRPALRANNQASSLNFKGEILFANKIKMAQPSPTSIKTTFMGSTLSRQKSISTPLEQFHFAQSSLHLFKLRPAYNGFISYTENHTELKEHQCFVGCAKEYILRGKSLIDVCDHNAKISKKYAKHNAAKLWNFIKILYGSDYISTTKKKDSRNSLSNQNSLTNQQRNDQDGILHHPDDFSDDGQINNLLNCQVDETKIMDYISPKSGEFKPLSLNNPQIIPEPIIFETSQITFDNFKDLRDGFLYYTKATDYTKGLSLPETNLNELQQQQQHQQQQKSKVVDKRDEASPPPNQPNILKLVSIPIIPSWEPHSVIANCLRLQVEIGDVQTSLCILIAMDELRTIIPIEETLIEFWFQSYIELLHRHLLYNEAATIIKFSWLRSIRELSTSAGWFRIKCTEPQKSICSVCNLLVKGLYAWCQGCSHGGHIEHLNQWFSAKETCPKCGHLCEYD